VNAFTSVVLVSIDAFGFLPLLVPQRSPILFGQMTIVLRSHPTLFFVDAGFLMFEMRCLARRKLAAVDSLADAVLLVLFALINIAMLRG